MKNEPCLCGDPNCPRCFPVSSEAYAKDMELMHLRHVADVALSCLAFVANGHPMADQSRNDLNRVIDQWRGEPND
jgi:hypothetical protein